MPNTHLAIGNGPHKVIGLHGWFGHAHGWGPFTQHLNGQDFSYAFMDQRGYGGMKGSGGPYTVEQIAQDALALADSLGWQRFSIMGHSMGGVGIQQVLVAAPERVRSLVLVEHPQGLKITRDYDISIPEFRGDSAQLIQALLNIVQNAAQALGRRIAEGDAEIILKTRVARQVTLGRERYRLALELHVIDNGSGVPDAIKERIFYPLVSGRDGGSGLGLTLAQTFVQRHHGLIECDSQPGRTDFRILIPLP